MGGVDGGHYGGGQVCHPNQRFQLQLALHQGSQLLPQLARRKGW